MSTWVRCLHVRLSYFVVSSECPRIHVSVEGSLVVDRICLIARIRSASASNSRVGLKFSFSIRCSAFMLSHACSCVEGPCLCIDCDSSNMPSSSDR